MSLDDLIAQKEKKSFSGANKRKSNDAGPARGPAKKHAVRSAPYENRPRRSEAPAQQMSFRAPQVVSSERTQNLSVFARIGKPVVSGTSVTFANLKPSVVEKDIQDLSTAIGEVKEVQLVVGRSGRNTATVLFARRSDALTCVTKLNGTEVLTIFPLRQKIQYYRFPQTIRYDFGWFSNGGHRYRRTG